MILSFTSADLAPMVDVSSESPGVAETADQVT